MHRFGEQLIKPEKEILSAAKSDKTLRQNFPIDEPPELVDVGLKMLVKSHSLHSMGADMLGSAAFESATRQSLNVGMQSAIEINAQNDAAVEILKKEQADFKRADEILRKLTSGEIGRDKKRRAGEEKERRRLETIH